MNTWIWGPPKWKFLHTLSYSPIAHQFPVQITDFVNTLKFVLPCIYCRESYTLFVNQVSAKMGAPLSSLVDTKQLPMFMYLLHDKVNEKLDIQSTHDRMEKEHVPLSTLTPEQNMAVCRKRQITFECLTKRFRIRPVQFSAEDVWQFLLIFSLNMDDTLERANEEQRQQWLLFFHLLPLMVRIASVRAKERLVRCLFALTSDVERVMQTKRASLFSTVLHQKCVFDKQPYNEQVVEKELQVYALARATTCTHGSCK
jgi:hypothetical protein